MCAAGNCIGEIGAAALGRALALRKEPCGKWTYNGAWEELCLASEAPGPSPHLLEPDAARCPSRRSWRSLVLALVLPLFCAGTMHGRSGPSVAFSGALRALLCIVSDNAIGSKGAKALAEGLKPQRNPGGRWQYNKTLKRLDLSGE